MAVKEKCESISDEIEWTVENEVQLFYAMQGHKPVGVNKYFQMACIVEKFRNYLNRDISSKTIWKHLDTMYDMQALDDTENLPFPNAERNFSLPPEYTPLIAETKRRRETGEVTTQDDKKVPTVTKKLKEEKREGSSKDVKEASPKKDIKDVSKETKKDIKDLSKETKKDIKDLSKESKKEFKDSKEPKKIIIKEVKPDRRESRDDKEVRKDFKKDSRETAKDIKKDPPEHKSLKPRSTLKEKKEYRKDEDIEDAALVTLITPRKDRVRELSESRVDDSPKRGGKRSTRGSFKPDDTCSNKSSSPITAATPPPMKRRRT